MNKKVILVRTHRNQYIYLTSKNLNLANLCSVGEGRVLCPRDYTAQLEVCSRSVLYFTVHIGNVHYTVVHSQN